ncbi:MAG: cation:proton antiporter [Desulfuromonadaceae bacterium]|nr:cation:proton antiporter [Desulfuromonadaceae bacterium]MDD2854724.1 cation:proton antiporter [Desulfuromonadaceae bacterium]
MQDLIPLLIVAVAVATLLNVVLKRFNMPTVIGYIFTGALIGPMFGINIHGNEALEKIAEFGIVFLMFIIGLEFSVTHLKSMKKEVFLFGGLQVAGTALLIAAAAAFFFGIEFQYAIVMGSALSLSSTAIVLKLLNESGKIRSEYGRNALGILLFQDIAVIPILLMITILTSNDKGLGELLLETAVNAALTLTILIIIGKFALTHLFRAVSNTNSKEIYMGSILFVVVGSSYIAHHFGFSYTLGAFIAGMMIADTIYKYQVEADLIPFRDLLLGVFFVTVGLQIDPGVVLRNILSVICLSLVIMILKTVSIYVVLIYFNSVRVTLKSAITLAQIGEFALVIFSLLMSYKMVDQNLGQIVMVTVVLSMIVTPFLLNNLDRIVNFIFRGKIERDDQVCSEVFGEHVILCGYGAFGRAVSEKLDMAGVRHVIVTGNTDGYVKAKELGKLVVFGDSADRVLLESLQIKKAISTIIAEDDVDRVKLVSAAISLIDRNLKVIAKVLNEDDLHQLTEFNHEMLLDGNSQAATLLVEQISKSKMLAEETSRLKYLSNYSINRPSEVISLVKSEQARLLDVISDSFDALRQGKDIMHIKALHASFRVLSEIIRSVISKIMSDADLSHKEYECINTLMDNQHQLETLSSAMEELGRDLKQLEAVGDTAVFSQNVVEALDTVLLSLKALAEEFSQDEMALLTALASDGNHGLSKIRETYLGESQHLEPKTKALFLSATNYIERVKALFRSVGDNYQKLAESQ